MTAPGDLLTVEEVAALTTLAPSTLYDWRARSAGGHRIGPRSIKLGARVVYRRSDVDAWLAAQEQATARGGAA